MDYLSWLHALNSLQERLEQRTIIFHAISPNMDDYDSETQFFKVVFVLKAFVNSYKDVTLVLGLSDQLRIGKGAPLAPGNTYNLMVRKGLLKTRIDTLI